MLKRIWLFIVVCFCFGFSQACFSAEATLKSFDDAISLAFRENPEFQALEKDIDAAQAGITSARLAHRYNPQLELDGSHRNKPNDAGEPGRQTFHDWGFGLSREIEIGGQKPLRLEAARLEERRTISASNVRRSELFADVKDAFNAAQGAQMKVALSRETEEIRKHLSEMVKKKFEAGEEAQVQVSMAEVEAAKAASERLAAEQAFEESLSRLRRAIGLDAAFKISIEGELPNYRVWPKQLIDEAFQTHSELKALKYAQAEAMTRKKLAIAEGRSNLTVGVSYAKEEGSTKIVQGRLDISLPLVNKNRGEADKARCEAEALQLRIAALERKIGEDITAAQSAYDKAARRFELLKSSVMPKSVENLNKMNDAYREGKIGLADVLVFQTEVLNSRQMQLDALIDLNRAGNDLERALGLP